MKVLKDKTVTIRTPQLCYGCGRRFHTGAKLRFQATVSDGNFSHSYSCGPCEQAFQAMNLYELEDFRPGCIEDWCEDWETLKKNYDGELSV